MTNKEKGAFLRSALMISAILGIGILQFEAKAAPIVYTESALGTGTLDGNSFTNKSFTITTTADTSRIYFFTNSEGYYLNVPDIMSSVKVSGIGTDSFTNTLNFFNPEIDGFGISDGGTHADILDLQTLALSNYDLSTSIGPLIGSSLVLNPGVSFGTDEGTFSLASARSVTFQATLEAAPEPATYALLGLGGVALIAANRARPRIAARHR